MQSSLTGLLQTFEKLKETQQRFVLATIVETAGSTYRKPGARMLITEQGDFYGLLSGGCLEGDLYEHAKTVFKEKQDATVFYDLHSSEDLIWGLGLGCDGSVRIRLEYISAENNYGALMPIKKALENNQSGVVITITDSGTEQLTTGSHYLITSIDNEDAPALPSDLIGACLSVLAQGKSTSITIEFQDNKITAFLGYVQLPLRLLIIGGGPDAVPVTEAARLLGWHITVTDYREVFTNAERFPCADQIIHSTPEQLQDKIDLDGIDALVLMTHKLEYDERYLKVLHNCRADYFGLLGPAARRQELMKALGDDAIKLQGKVYGPVGLDIGSELPEEIAFALVAEIQTVNRNRTGGHLSHLITKMEETQCNASLPVDSLYGVVLAAGSAKRFGALKQLLEFNGRSLLRQATENLVQHLGKRVFVVHGPKALKCQRELSSLDIKHIINQDYESGMAWSLKQAVAELPYDCMGVLISLCDQPLINAAHIQELIETWKQNPDKIVCSHFENSYGVPAILPRKYFTEIQRLTGDRGAKPVLDNHENELVFVSIAEAGFDIDTQSDYETLLKQQILMQ